MVRSFSNYRLTIEHLQALMLAAFVLGWDLCRKRRGVRRWRGSSRGDEGGEYPGERRSSVRTFLFPPSPLSQRPLVRSGSDQDFERTNVDGTDYFTQIGGALRHPQRAPLQPHRIALHPRRARKRSDGRRRVRLSNGHRALGRVCQARRAQEPREPNREAVPGERADDLDYERV